MDPKVQRGWHASGFRFGNIGWEARACGRGIRSEFLFLHTRFLQIDAVPEEIQASAGCKNGPTGEDAQTAARKPMACTDKRDEEAITTPATKARGKTVHKQTR